MISDENTTELDLAIDFFCWNLQYLLLWNREIYCVETLAKANLLWPYKFSIHHGVYTKLESGSFICYKMRSILTFFSSTQENSFEAFFDVTLCKSVKHRISLRNLILRFVQKLLCIGKVWISFFVFFFIKW